MSKHITLFNILLVTFSLNNLQASSPQKATKPNPFVLKIDTKTGFERGKLTPRSTAAQTNSTPTATVSFATSNTVIHPEAHKVKKNTISKIYPNVRRIIKMANNMFEIQKLSPKEKPNESICAYFIIANQIKENLEKIATDPTLKEALEEYDIYFATKSSEEDKKRVIDYVEKIGPFSAMLTLKTNILSILPNLARQYEIIEKFDAAQQQTNAQPTVASQPTTTSSIAAASTSKK